jgi:imidazolonepropionase-like amidohydrolase
MKRDLLSLLLALLTATGCAAPPRVSPTATFAATTPSSAATVSSDTLVLVNGTLIDGTGANPVLDAVVVIQGKHIVAAGPRTKVTIPRGARRIDLGSATILPGFINAHVHNAYEAQNLMAWAQAGVTTVRDEGILSSAQSLPDLIARRNTEWSQPPYARLVSAGWMTTVPQGYGGLYVTSAADAHQKTVE